MIVVYARCPIHTRQRNQVQNINAYQQGNDFHSDKYKQVSLNAKFLILLSKLQLFLLTFNFHSMKMLNRLFSIILVSISIYGCTSTSKLPVNFNSKVGGAEAEVKKNPNRIATKEKTSVTLKLPSNGYSPKGK